MIPVIKIRLFPGPTSCRSVCRLWPDTIASRPCVLWISLPDEFFQGLRRETLHPFPEDLPWPQIDSFQALRPINISTRFDSFQAQRPVDISTRKTTRSPWTPIQAHWFPFDELPTPLWPSSLFVAAGPLVRWMSLFLPWSPCLTSLLPRGRDKGDLRVMSECKPRTPRPVKGIELNWVC